MRSFVVSKVVAGRAVDMTKLIDILIIAGLAALMLFHTVAAPSMA